MRFMIIVKATKDSEAGRMPEDSLIAAMGKYHEELARAGVLIDGSGLKPTSTAWRVKYNGDQRSFVDGPFAETKELIAGYTIIRTKTREEAIEWTRRFPNPAHGNGIGEIEVRQFYELEDFAPTPAVERMKEQKLFSQDTALA
jgi:hypothetical protein